MFAWLTQFSGDPLITYHDHVGGEHQRDDGDGWIAMQMTKISYTPLSIPLCESFGRIATAQAGSHYEQKKTNTT